MADLDSIKRYLEEQEKDIMDVYIKPEEKIVPKYEDEMLEEDDELYLLGKHYYDLAKKLEQKEKLIDFDTTYYRELTE